MDCFWCEEPIGQGEEFRDMPHLAEAGPPEMKRYHLDCTVRMIVGGLNHQKGLCTCCGGSLPPDPPEMTAREAARAAAEYFRLSVAE